MRLHFTIGCYDRRWTSRRRQSFQFSRVPGLRVDAGKHLFSESDKNAAFLSPLT